MKQILTTKEAKNQATLLAAYLGSIKRTVSHGNALEAVAVMHGAKSWNVFSTQLETDTPSEESETSSKESLHCFAEIDGVRQRLTVSAEVHTDNHRREVEFDATPWFIQAADEEILALAAIGWKNDAEADEVAEYVEQLRHDVDVNGLFSYLEQANNDSSMLDDNIGFEVSVDRASALSYCRAFRYAVYVRIILKYLTEAGVTAFVQEDDDHPGKWIYYFGLDMSDYSYDTENEAYEALGFLLDLGEFSCDLNMLIDTILTDVSLSVRPKSGTFYGNSVQSTPKPIEANLAGPGKVHGRFDAEDNTGAVMVIQPGAEPLSPYWLKCITADGRYSLQVAVPVDLDTLINGDIETLNDLVSVIITGSSVELSDISYSRYSLKNESALIDTSQVVYILVVAKWEPVDGMPEVGGDDADVEKVNRIRIMPDVHIDYFWGHESNLPKSERTIIKGILCKIGTYPDYPTDDEDMTSSGVFYFFENEAELRGVTDGVTDIVITAYTLGTKSVTLSDEEVIAQINR